MRRFISCSAAAVADFLQLENRPRCHFFTTFFYKKLMGERGGYNYKNVKRWTKDIKLPDYDFCFIPIHVDNMHWCLASINFKAKRILYYDSLHGDDHGVMRNLLCYVRDESMAKLQRPVNMDEWQLEVVEEVPHQLNGFDCGVFTCKMADYLGEGRPLVFTQADMPYFRRRMLLEIRLATLDL
jgi:sentrin-specific protease 1